MKQVKYKVSVLGELEEGSIIDVLEIAIDQDTHKRALLYYSGDENNNPCIWIGIQQVDGVYIDQYEDSYLNLNDNNKYLFDMIVDFSNWN